MESKIIQEGFEIKRLDSSHLEQFNALLRYAFQVTDEELVKVGWEANEIKQAKFPILKAADVLGWFEGDKLASQIAIYPMKVNIHGEIMDMGLVTGVSTYPEYMGMGLMSTLIKKSLGDMRSRNQSISFLYPYSIPFYRHKGWEIVSDKMTFRIKDNQLPKEEPVPGRIKRVPQDSPDLIELHNRFARKTHGCLIREELAWSEYWRWEVDDVLVAIYYDEAGEAKGYLIYLLENDIFRVKEMVYLNDEARKGIWGYISAHYSMVNEVVGNNFSNHALSFVLDDGDIKETVQPYIMARIVDFKEFMNHYHFSECIPNQSITFKITDTLLDWNNGIFTLHFDEEGHCTISDTLSQQVVTLTIGIATSMLMGYKRPSYLKSIEKIEADEKTIALLERLIPKEKVYFSDYI